MGCCGNWIYHGRKSPELYIVLFNRLPNRPSLDRHLFVREGQRMASHRRRLGGLQASRHRRHVRCLLDWYLCYLVN